MAQRDLFDLNKGQEARDEGMKSASEHQADMLKIARQIAFDIAYSRCDGMVTADDVYRELERQGYDINLLGNAAGSIFKKNPFFKPTIIRRQSERVSNHARSIMVWKLR
jgi:hypothetical protein